MSCYCGNAYNVKFINMQTCMCCRIKQRDLLYYRLSFPIDPYQINVSRLVDDIQNEEFVYCHKCASYVHVCITERMIMNKIVPLIDRNYDTLNRCPCEIPRPDGSYSWGHIISSRANPPIYIGAGICVCVSFESGGKFFKKYTNLINLIKHNSMLRGFLREDRLVMNLEHEFVAMLCPDYTKCIKLEFQEIFDHIKV